MKIALLGYGKMGKAIEAIAVNRKHEICLKIDSSNAKELNAETLKEADVAIEFSRPDVALKNISLCLESNVPIVVGTTGWYEKYSEIKEQFEEQKGALLTATNFSVGVNLFFELNKKLAQLMSPISDYKARITEVHHTEKLDSPSGTAISLAEQIIDNHATYSAWKNEESNQASDLVIESIREHDVKGTHEIVYESAIDRISIEHFAKNREGFALGAVIAAEFLKNNTGVFTMKDVLNL